MKNILKISLFIVAGLIIIFLYRFINSFVIYDQNPDDGVIDTPNRSYQIK